MTRLSLALLGPMQITLDRLPVGGIAYNKARALLAYLAVERNYPHARDALATLLWPDVPDDAARHNLRQALANLRAAIGDANATPPFLRITRDTIEFNQGSDDQLDVAAFTALLTACKAHSHRHPERCGSCAARIEQALALYHGDFLAGFSVDDSAPFEEWQLRQRERLHQQALEALIRLAEYHERRGEGERARQYAQRQIELEPWREEAHRQLMRLLAHSGQRSAAIAQYETCRRILARDLGVEPEAETTALYKLIRDMETRRPGDAETNAKIEASSLSPTLLVSPAPRQNFPAQITPLIGREAELAELGALLENPTCRLITIAGPGGIGKTRVALAAAVQQADVFTHGAVFVSLQAISSPALAPPAILAALDIPLQGQPEPRDQLLGYLRGKELLIVLDNVEQLLADQSERGSIAELLADILASAPGVTLLVTSRERLALNGEWLVDLSGLNYPTGESGEAIERCSAVQLFVQRAAQVRRQFVLDGQAHSVARICRLVEGLPLAIELAAAALRTHSCTAIADAIESSLSTLASGLRAIPERHRSIWATFEHSWRLLSDEERQVFPRLAVFRGGFEKEAAIQVAQASPQLLASLADKSLLRWDGAARYDLHELVRQYAFDKLQEAGERVQTQDRHLVYFLELVEQADAELTSPRRRIRLEQLDAEYNNLRAALEYCKVQGYGELWLRLAAVLWLYWEASGRLHEGLGWLEDALAGASGDAQVEASVVPDRRAIARVHAAAAPRAHALIGAAQLARHYGDCARAAAWAEESLALCREQEELWGTAASLNILGRAERDRGDYARAERLLEENLRIYRALNDAEGIAYTLMSLSYVVDHGGDHARAVAMNEESLSLSRARGDRRGSAWALQFLGNSARSLGSYARATELLEESLALFQEQRVKPGIAQVLTNLGLVARDQGDYPAACRRFEQSLGLWREMGIWQDIVRLLELLETTTRNQGDDTAAHAFYRERVELMEMPSPTS